MTNGAVISKNSAGEDLSFRSALLGAQNEATPDGILVVDSKGKILSYNKRFAQMWHMPAEILEAKDDKAALKFAMTQLANPAEFINRVKYLYAHPDETSYEEINLKDGRIFERYGTPVKNPDGYYYGWLWHFHDITKRKSNENRQEFLDKVSDTLFTSFEDDHTVKKVAQLILSNIADYCRIVTLDEDNNISDISVNHTDPTKVQLATDLYDAYKNDVDAPQGVHKILKTGKAELVSAIDKSVLGPIKNNRNLVKIVKSIGLKSYMGIPLKVNHKTIGAITFSSVKPGRNYDKDDLVYAKEIGRRIALALDNARLYRETKRARQDAERQRQRLYDLFMQAPAMISITHGPNHVYELANPLYVKVVGKTKAIIGKSVIEVFPELKGQEIMGVLDNVYKSGKPFIGNELPIKLDVRNTGNPEERYFNFVYQPSRNTAGKVDGILTHAIDVTGIVITRQKIEKSEQHFRALIEHSADAIAMTDKDGTVIYASASVKKLLGYSSAEMVGKPGSIFVHPDDLEMAHRKLLGINQKPGKALTVEHRACHKNGSIRWVETTATNLIEEPSVGAVVINFRDITERKQAEERLRDSEERAQAVFDQAATAISLTTLDGKWIRFNRVYPKMFGYSRAELSKMTFTQITHPDDRPADKVHIKDLINGKIKEYVREKRYIHKNGSIVYAVIHVTALRDTKGKAQYLIAVLQDVTKRKQAEEKLQESEERLRFMSESLPQMVFTADPSGSVDYFNPQWMEYTGLTFEQIRDWGWLQFIHPDDVDENVRRWKHSVNTGKPFELEHRFRRYDGVYRWHISRARPMRDDKGKIIRWFGSNTDIDDMRRTTKRKNELEKITSTLTAQRAELVVLNRAKDEFISVASHQLRTPATGVKQYIGMLLEGYAGSLSPEQESFLRSAYESNERQINIVNDLLKVATVDAGKVVLNVEAVDIIALVGSVIKDLDSKFRAHSQTVTFKPKHKKILVTADLRKMRMVLENIIDNASKYTYDNKAIEITVTKSADFVQVAVIDEGVGISKADQQKIFRKFSIIDNPLSAVAGGTGIGLYWARKIIELHGGSIKVESSPKKGSIFTIKIPA